MSNVEKIECSNPACNCFVTAVIGAEDLAHCSDYCREADESEEIDSCSCGHPPCDVE